MRAVNDFVVIKMEPAEETTESGLVLPEDAQRRKTNEGEVFSIGPDVSLDIEVGSLVYFLSGVEVTGGADRFTIVRAENIAFVL